MIQLNLPLSATALREGAEFLTKLSQLADVIRDEVRGPAAATVGTLSYTVDVDTAAATASLEALEQKAAQVAVNVPDDVVIDVNVRPAGGDHDAPLTAAGGSAQDAFAQDVQYETVVTGHERNPDYTGELAAYDQAALEAAGWDVAGLLAAGYLREVTEQRPLAVAPTAPQAPTPPAPSAAPAPAAAGGEVELDVDGLPWDARIHSDATERKAKTGKWKTRKNLPDGYKEQIEAELRGLATAPVAPAPAATPAPAPAPSAPSPAAIVAPAPTPGGMTFPQFVQWAMGHTKAGRCNQTDVQLAVQEAGLATVPDLSKRIDLIPQVMATLKRTKGIE